VTIQFVDIGGIVDHDCLIFLLLALFWCKRSKGQSESVYRRRTDNTMAKRKSTKGQTMIYKAYT